MPRKQTETYYHCAFAKSLPGIAKRGLVPAAVPGLLRAAPGNLRGVYLSDAAGVRFWFSRLIDWAHNDSDTPVEDGLVPVVLRVETACDVVEDKVGARDSRADAVICRRPIPPGAIRVWDGREWVRVSRGVDASLGAEWVEDEDYDDGGYWDLLSAFDSPLMPHSTR